MVDYKKWDRIELSDDDDIDCHPNIERLTWRRMKRELRDRQLAEDQEKRRIELVELESLKYSLFNKKPDTSEKSIENLEKRICELEEREARRKRTEETQLPKLTGDLLCHDGFDSSAILGEKNKSIPSGLEYDCEQAEVKECGGPVVPEQHEQDLESLICHFVDLKTYQGMAEYLFRYPELISDNVDTVLIMNAHAYYQEKDASQSYEYLRHSLVIRYILRLSEGNRNILQSLRIFFEKISDNMDNQYLKGFESDLFKFFDRLKKLPSFQS